MKSVWINILLLLSVGAMLFVYTRKDKTPDHVDYVELSLSGLKKILPPGARLRYEGIQTDTVNQFEPQLLVRYALIPAVVAADISSDTCIYIARLNDSLSTSPAGTVLWQHRDSVYSYQLIKKDVR